MPSIPRHTHRPALALACALLLAATGCGAQLEADNRDGSNFNADDFKKAEAKPIVPVTQPIGTAQKPHEVRDPDGLLYRVDSRFHDHLAEIRLEQDGQILLIFRSSEAIKLRPEDLDAMQLTAIQDGKLVIKIREQEFRLTQHTS